MKIAINGDLIDTEDIYMITKLTGNEYKNLSIFTKDQIHDHQLVQYEFKIIMFNKIEILVQSDIDFYSFKAERNIRSLKYNLTNLQKEMEMQFNRISVFKQLLEDIWSKHQSNIPQFDLKLTKI